MLARVLLLGLLALVGLSFPAWATGPANYPPGGSGSGVVANTCTSGDFFSAVDGSGNFTCATPAGSGDVTAVGDCASGNCFDGTTGNSLQFEGSTANGFETALTATDPTADRTITMPNRSGQMALERTINLYDYAACNGTDESTAIQSAITAACALGPGGTLYVPADTCVFASTLTLCSGLAIIGSDGTERSAYGVAYPHELSYSGTGTAIDAQDFVGVRLAGVLLRATSASFAGPLLDADGIDYLHLDRVSMAAATQAGAATCALVSMNDTSDISIDSSSFTGCGYALKARVLSSNYSNVVRLSHNAFYRSEVCSVLNPGGAWEVTNNKWQPQGYADERSSIFCHGAGICAEGLQLSANMVVDQPSGPTVAEFELCGSGLSITGNFFGGNSTQDAIGFSEPCDGCTISGNEFIQIDEPVVFTGTGGNSVKQTMLGNAMSTVATVPYFGIYRTGSGGTFINEPTDIYANVDTDANSGSGAFVIGSNARDSSSTQQYVFLEGGYAQFRRGNDLRFHETDDSNYVQLSAPTLSGDYTLTLPTTDGATNDLLYNTDGSGTLGWRTPNAGTDITADLEEETHASEHSAGGADAITVTNLASACTDAQVIGGNAGGTGVECQTDDDVPEVADYSNLTAGTGITNSPTGTINATLGTAITSSEITDGEIVNADISATAAIALSKLANMSTDRLLGRDTAGSGAIEEISVTSPLGFSGAGAIALSQNAGTDVTADLEEESHCSEHDSADVDCSGETIIFAANSVDAGNVNFNYAAGDAEAGKALYINATNCSAGVITASDGTPSCLTASSTPEFVSRVMTAGGTLGNYAVVMANGSNDDEVIEATTSTTQILGCSQDSDGTTSTNPVEVAVAGIARCKADSTVTAGSLVKLGATGEFALATTADKTWGRAVTDDDAGSASAYILLFDGAEGTIDHALDLWTSIPDLTSNTLSIINANPTVSMTSTGTLNGVNFAPAFTTSGIGLLTGFNFQPTYSHSSLVSQLYGFNMVGTYTSTDASAGLVASIMRNNATYTSSTANAEPFSSLIAVDDKPAISNTTATTSTSTPTSYITIRHDPVISINDADGATGGLAAMTLTDDAGFVMSGTYTETSGTLAVTNRIGFQYNEVTNTSTATAITNNIGVDIAALGAAGATNNIGIRNADTTVYTPCTDNISSNTDYLAAPACTVVNLTAGGVRDLTAGTDQIANGVDGQIVTYFFSGSNSIAFNDGDNLNLTGTITLSAGDTLMLVYSSTTGDWMQLGTSNN